MRIVAKTSRLEDKKLAAGLDRLANL